MSKIVLGDNQYGKAETHLVHVDRTGETYRVTDFLVSISLAGDFAGSHMTGDNSKVVATDTQKNTVFAFAKEAPPGQPEAFALRLARHFAHDFEAVSRARVHIEAVPWTPIDAGGSPDPHAFERWGADRRLATVTCTKDQEWVVSGLADLVVIKTTDSEFHGFPRDRYTTLEDTDDRILATGVTARWRHGATDVDWRSSFELARSALLAAFATHHSLALQQTLYTMGEALLEAAREIVEVRLSMQNKHHFSVDLAPFGLTNDNEVFYASDRPYGLIEGTVTRDDASDPGLAW
jgi:urate oxidase